MSLIKTLKNSPKYQLNIVDIIEQLIPGKKTKYVELMLRLMKNTIDLNHHVGNLKDELSNTYGIERESIENMDTLSLLLYYNFLSQTFSTSDIAMMQKFCEYNERGVIVNNDISTYKSFDEIIVSIGLAEMKELEKELEAQVIKVFEDDEWVLVKPLTFHASKKYGSSTKWCTTMENEPTYFLEYSKNGILIYTINKKTGFKVATHFHIGNNMLTFWDQPDKQVDSMRCGLPKFILNKIEDEITLCTKPNYTFLSDEDKVVQSKLLFQLQKSRVSSERPLGGVVDRGDVPMPEELRGGFGMEEPMDVGNDEPLMDDHDEIIDREYRRIRRERLIELTEQQNEDMDLELEIDGPEDVEVPVRSIFDYSNEARIERYRNLGAEIREIDTSEIPRNEHRLVQRDNSGVSEWISPRMSDRMGARSEERPQQELRGDR
jgi:hypothetical protein